MIRFSFDEPSRNLPIGINLEEIKIILKEVFFPALFII